MHAATPCAHAAESILEHSSLPPHLTLNFTLPSHTTRWPLLSFPSLLSLYQKLNLVQIILYLIYF
eukprot:SAG31_NODE_37371_length_304_cov_9.521951_1_plen_64_part_01